MAPHSSTLAWKIPWTEEPGGLQSMGSLRVRHDWATSLSLFSLSCIGEGSANPLQCSWLENPRDGGAWWAAVYGVAQSRTWLKRLSSSSSKLLKVVRDTHHHDSSSHIVLASFRHLLLLVLLALCYWKPKKLKHSSSFSLKFVFAWDSFKLAQSLPFASWF